MENQKETKKEKQYKTDGGKTKSNAVEVPSISLPKGGGAIKGIDQKFTVNAVNGTAAFSVPLPVSQARGAAPALSLSYNSGGGNGIFGLGWNLSLPSIKRKTDKELPQYNDYIDSDTFLLSEAEDLVPEYERYDGTNDPNVGNSSLELDNPADIGVFIKTSDGKFIIREIDSTDTLWTIRFYKPRIEGLFARIERWTKKSNGAIRWRVISKENITTLYGWNSDGRSCIYDPANPSHVFEWLPEYVIDDKGNCAYYEYAKEDDAGFDTTKTHNRNRKQGANISYTNNYLLKVWYGNKTPRVFADVTDSLATSGGFNADFMFETSLDYGQYNPLDPHATLGAWDFREDAFSEYKSGFEIRTTRLCKRLLLFHHFPDVVSSVEQNTYLDGGHALVKSLDLEYDDNGTSGFTFLKSITSKGYIRYIESSVLKYSSKSLPAMVFEYEGYGPNNEVKEISADDVANAPSGLSKGYQFTDLFNEGLSGILIEQAGAWYYKSNFGEGKFGHARAVSPKPSFNGLNGNLQLIDLDGDGLKQMVNFSDSPHGFFEITDDPNETKGAGFQWQRFKHFEQLPTINFKDPNAKLIDLNGDGKTDLLITEEQVFAWYESDGKQGFKERYTSPKFLEEEDGPRLVFAEGKQTIFLADMSGDGLVDLVRIRNGEVCYWPNLGYGRFGKKVQMDNSPVMDNDADFNPAYVKLADIDGSGTPDLIYLGKNKFSYWRNFSGNAYHSPTPIEISGFPAIHPDADVTVTDLLGTGLQCVVWNSSLSKDAGAPLRYIDLMDSKKPHIMKKWRNGLGIEVELEYTPSTKYYIDDKLAGTPWATRLHFPVYCLSKVITSDKVTGNVFTNSYTYHHGYYDHAEKEFRGFGRVDQTDTEVTENYKNNSGTIANNSLNQAPIFTRSWFHTGAYLRDKKILDQFASEYWHEEYQRNSSLPAISPLETTLPQARIIPDGLNVGNNTYADNISGIEKRQAYRACKNMPLRVEVFSKEGTAEEQAIPVSVSTHNCMIEVLQPMGDNKHAVFCVKESEAITYSYERAEVNDPRIQHKLNLEMDVYGNVLKSASVVYPRLVTLSTPSSPTAEQTAAYSFINTIQGKCLVTFTENTFTNDINDPDAYRLRLPSESKTYEVTRLWKKPTASAPSATNIYDIDDFNGLLSEIEIPYEQTTVSTTVANIRLIEHVRSLYYAYDLSGPMSLGSMSAWGLPYENYQLAYTNNPSGTTVYNLVANVFGTKVGSTELDAGDFYKFGSDTRRWIRSGVMSFVSGAEDETDALGRFFIPLKYTDQRGKETIVDYDTNFRLFIERTEDAVGNENFVEKFNYRTLAPLQMKDQNDNLSEVIIDELGLPKALVLKNKNSGSDKADEVNNLKAYTLKKALTTDPDEEQDKIEKYFLAANQNITDANVDYNGGLQTYAAQLLDRATARFAYDFACYDSSGNFVKPAVVSSILREEHYNISPSDNRTQISFEYSSGSGQVVMKKIQAEPGEAKMVSIDSSGNITITTVDTSDTSNTSYDFNPNILRWIGNGRTILNNKGNPVKQYEPFFSTTAGYEDAKEMVEQGVTALMHYDGLGRLIRTDFPDGTFTKAEYFGWKQVSYDQNDTSDDSDWYTTMSGSSNAEDNDAAQKASDHYDTPKTVHFDTLGRPVMEEEIIYNPIGPSTTLIYTRLVIDIENNLREVWGPKIYSPNLPVMSYKYDMLGQMVYQESIDSGKRWLLHNCMGSPLRTWDERSFEVRFSYDDLHRPKEVTVLNGDGASALNNKVDLYIYGDDSSVTSPKANNLRGQLYKHYDTGGLEQIAGYDFKGAALSTERWLTILYKTVVDWNTLTGKLESNSYVIATEFDALGRIKLQTAPNTNTIKPSYNQRGLLYAEQTKFSAGAYTDALKQIFYDAKNQRTFVKYGNDVTTNFTYDELTFRVKRILTQKSGTLQDLNYTYDAVGNITQVNDAAVLTIFYNNTAIDAVSDYTYDSLYRLLVAKGRELNDVASFGANDNWDNSPFINSYSTLGSVALQNYTQTYVYDIVGNMTSLQHAGSSMGSYTRTNVYSSANNRLSSSQIGTGTPYSYNYHTQHGFLTNMPHLPGMNWNFKEELFASSQSTATSPAVPETTYYQYDSKGKRLRKITEKSTANGGGQKELRVYIEGYEYYENFNTTYVTHSLSLIDQGNRFLMIERSTKSGITSPLTRYIHANHQSSCNLETDDSGNVITYEEYHPFGTTAYQLKNPSINALAKRYRYTGMERDDETGLNYHNARYYIPWLCRWLNPDPIGIGDGVNVFAYCRNNSMTYRDTQGTQITVEAANRLPKNTVPSSTHTPPNLSFNSTILKTNNLTNPVSAGTYAGVTTVTSSNPQPTPLRKYHQNKTETTGGDTTLKATSNLNTTGQSYEKSLDAPSNEQIMEQAVLYLNQGNFGLKYKGVGANTSGDVTLSNDKISVTVNPFDPNLKLGTNLKIGNQKTSIELGESSMSYGPVFLEKSVTEKSETGEYFNSEGVKTGTLQIRYLITDRSKGFMVGTAESKVEAIKSFTPVVGQPTSEKLLEIKTTGPAIKIELFKTGIEFEGFYTD